MLLLPENAKLIGQGITGSEGSRALSWALKYGTGYVAGVTPGKGGQEINGIPIFNSVKEAIDVVGPIDASVSFVPPQFVKFAVFESIEAGIKFNLIVAEKVPTKDAALIYAKAKENEVNIIGPNSVGLICPSRKLKLGLIGGGEPEKVFMPGEIGVISKSGSMTAEISLGLKNVGLGVSWAVCIGGDRIIGTDFVDFLLELEKDPKTSASVIFGELGGTYEERLAKMVENGQIKKPIVAFIAGEFTLSLPSEVQFGHAGAIIERQRRFVTSLKGDIIEGTRGLPDHKRQVLREAGVRVADKLDQIPELLKGVING